MEAASVRSSCTMCSLSFPNLESCCIAMSWWASCGDLQQAITLESFCRSSRVEANCNPRPLDAPWMRATFLVPVSIPFPWIEDDVDDDDEYAAAAQPKLDPTPRDIRVDVHWFERALLESPSAAVKRVATARALFPHTDAAPMLPCILSIRVSIRVRSVTRAAMAKSSHSRAIIRARTKPGRSVAPTAGPTQPTVAKSAG
mmetsp:Transcript_4059/g.10371  ORF Transcript_4059/g.10371 Transcript_4059/m.10371 type:complete len:200 (+) Transcript_4059:626-1225(+)